jgi:hypothetical protein
LKQLEKMAMTVSHPHPYREEPPAEQPDYSVALTIVLGLVAAAYLAFAL